LIIFPPRSCLTTGRALLLHRAGWSPFLRVNNLACPSGSQWFLASKVEMGEALEVAPLVRLPTTEG